jgi:DNA-binding GntR family transcriptional regulator
MDALDRVPAAGPLYAQIEARLLERLQADFRPGQLLPTQRELARQFGASLITVKRALHELVRKGLLQSTRGRGTVVTRPVVAENRSELAGFTDAMAGLGRRTRTVSSDVRVHVPPPETARLLGLRAREKSVLLERLRSLDGHPYCLMSNELPLALAPRLAEGGLPDESLYAWLRREAGLVPHRAEEEVSARPPSAAERRFLGAGVAVVLVVRRHTRLPDGRPLEIAELVADARHYRYRMEVLNRP